MKQYLIFALVLCLNACVSSNQEQALDLSTEINGHRGLRGLYPENSLYGFKQTIDKGYYKLELDLIMTADSQLVVFHDPRVTDAICEVDEELDIYAMSYAELAAIQCGTVPSERFPDQKKHAHSIPLFKDFLNLCMSHPMRDSLSLVVEIKSPRTYETDQKPSDQLMVRTFLEAIEQAGAYEQTTLQSFDPLILEACREMDTELPLLFLFDELQEVSTALDDLSFTPNVVGVNYEWLTKAKVEAFHERGISVTAWTVNDWEDIVSLSQMGVDDVMSDYYWEE